MKFKSFVFLDLESTGLPFHEPDGKRTRITEICMASVTKEHLLNCADETNNYRPRVLHKLTLPINPGKVISQEAASLSHLDNFLLEYEEPLNEKTTAAIASFLNICSPPVCLVAHNGYLFDFPLLREEFKKFNHVIVPLDVCCSDSRIAFRELSKIKELENLRYGFPKKCPVIDNSLTLIERDRSPIRFSSDITDIDLAFNEVAQEIERLHPPRRGNSEFKATGAIKSINETTPKSRQLIASSSSSHTTLTGERRQLFVNQKNPYSLSNMYKMLFGEEFANQHEAESDVMAMIKCCAKFGKHVVDWFERNHKLFRDVKSMYE